MKIKTPWKSIRHFIREINNDIPYTYLNLKLNFNNQKQQYKDKIRKFGNNCNDNFNGIENISK